MGICSLSWRLSLSFLGPLSSTVLGDQSWLDWATNTLVNSVLGDDSEVIDVEGSVLDVAGADIEKKSSTRFMSNAS